VSGIARRGGARRGGAAVGVLFALVLSLGPGSDARADKLDVRAQYEEKLVHAALQRRGLSPGDVHPMPEGKIIEAIEIDASEIILHGDLPLSGRLPWTFLNRFHVRTRDAVIARELLFAVGDSFRSDLFEESGRNVRNLAILAVARLVVVAGSDSDRVRVLVVTKDQWSLRLNTSFNLDQARFDSLSFQFAELNLAGRNKRVSVDFGLDPGRYNVGGSYTDPRIWGSRHAAKLTGEFFINRDTGSLEGGLVQFAIGRPLYRDRKSVV